MGAPAGLGSVRRPRAVRELLAGGWRFLAALVRGRSPAIGIPFLEFARAVLSSLRPHYFVFPGAAALAGAAAAPRVEAPWRVLLIALATALSWGIGQLINDLMDVEADRIDAPDRAGVRGLLPEGPTVAVAMLLACVVTLAVGSADPALLPLLFLSALLLLAYHPAKTLGLGNLAHGALMGSVAALGFVAAVPSAPLGDSLVNAGGVVLVTALFAATYLQANYEKDCAGDRVAGYRTLAHVLGLRWSGIVRLLGGALAFVLAQRFGLLRSTPSFWLLLAAETCLLWSVIPLVLWATPRAALVGYRFAVHTTTLALCALASSMLGIVGTLVAIGLGLFLVERAFFNSQNP